MKDEKLLNKDHHVDYVKTRHGLFIDVLHDSDDEDKMEVKNKAQNYKQQGQY